MNNSRPVYYVVRGSFSSLKNAKEVQFNWPDFLDCNPIFIAKAKGKTVYRICLGIYYNKENAQRCINDIKEYYGWEDLWIWKNNGHAKCVYRPNDYNGQPVRITPSD